MKKSTLFLFAIMALFLTGCNSKKTDTIKDAAGLDGKVFGVISPWVSTDVFESAMANTTKPKAGEIIYYNRHSDIVAAMIAGKIDAAQVLKIVADYSAKRNEMLKIIQLDKKYQSSVVMALRSEDKQLKADIDSAITLLQTNGILKQLEDLWITNLPVENEPSNKEIPKIEGAKIIYIGVSGDVTPLDYIAADGRPAGYNVALLTEIGKILNVNFEFVSIETQAKITALSSKKIDVIFCHMVDDEIPTFFGDEYIMTRSYFTDEEVCFLVRK